MRAGICSNGKIHSVDIRCGIPWMKKYRIRGIVLWPNILFAECDVPSWLFRHELEHAFQIALYGPWKFYWLYFKFAVQKKYRYQNHPFEVEARQAQLLDLTEQEEAVLWRLNDDSMRSLNA